MWEHFFVQGIEEWSPGDTEVRDAQRSVTEISIEVGRTYVMNEMNELPASSRKAEFRPGTTIVSS